MFLKGKIKLVKILLSQQIKILPLMKKYYIMITQTISHKNKFADVMLKLKSRFSKICVSIESESPGRSEQRFFTNKGTLLSHFRKHYNSLTQKHDLEIW